MTRGLKRSLFPKTELLCRAPVTHTVDTHFLPARCSVETRRAHTHMHQHAHSWPGKNSLNCPAKGSKKNVQFSSFLFFSS